MVKIGSTNTSLVLLLLSVVGVLETARQSDAASVLTNLPGAGFMRDLSYGIVDTLNGAVDAGVSAFREQVPQVDQYLDEFQEFAYGAPTDPDLNRNVSEIIRSRGFKAEEYDVVTKDGYILTIQRIINPLVDPSYRKNLKPVILQHGLMSSSVDWVINSLDVKPSKYPPAKLSSNSNHDNDDNDDNEEDDDNDTYDYDDGNSSPNTIEGHQRRRRQQQQLDDNLSNPQEHPNGLGFYLANQGYDVFLANSRGNFYGQRHVKLNSWFPKFWSFTFDEQIQYDLPDIIEFVQKLTNHTKVGYVGHSQGTTMMLGLLADRPEYADIVEPVVLLAPVAYVNNCVSPVRHFAPYTPLFQHINMWFATSNAAIRYLGPIVCGPEIIRRDLCENIIFLSTGFDEAEFNLTRVGAYLNHMPSGTSVKNIAHWGQMVQSGRFAHFDHGILGNMMKYGQTRAPDYDLSKIRSNSLALFVADNDWLAAPKDVAHLISDLKVKPYGVYNISEYKPKWNHIDFVYGKDAGELVNTKIIEIFSKFK